MTFIIFISFFVLIRLAELIYAKKNEQWLLQNGAIEYGAEHYPFIVILHSLFIVSLLLEYYWKGEDIFNPIVLFVYIFCILIKGWVIFSLGKYWNTKIFRIPHALLIRKGPYKFIKHPNYIIVIAEIAVIPLIFNLYYTAIIFSILNAIILSIRISVENKALGE